MRIAYGVFGYGRGHATRTAAVLPELTRRHDVLLLAGGDAYEQLRGQYPVVEIPTLGYAYRPGARRSNWLTLRRNGWHVLDMLLRGPAFQLVERELRDFRPDVAISDAEPWTHRVARRLAIPRIAFDHFGILVHCRVPVVLGDRARLLRDVLVYRWLMGAPQRVLVSSFYDAPPVRPGVRVVGALLRDEVLAQRPQRGDYLLAYFNKGEHQFTAAVRSALAAAGLPVRIYGTPHRGRDGPLLFRPASNVPFVEDLAGCRAVISTAGNQLVGEALHLGKPLLVIPEDCVEQRLNAAAVARLGIGLAATQRTFSARHVAELLAREAEFLARIARFRRDGRADALAALEQFLQELAPPRARRADPVPGAARCGGRTD